MWRERHLDVLVIVTLALKLKFNEGVSLAAASWPNDRSKYNSREARAPSYMIDADAHAAARRQRRRVALRRRRRQREHDTTLGNETVSWELGGA